MEYKVPQNIDIEDKVVGPLTLRQFVILLIAAAFVVVLNFSLTGALRFLFFLLAILIVGGALALAFFDYGGQHLEKIIADAIVSLIGPKKMIWKKEVEAQPMDSQTQAQDVIPQVTTRVSFEETKNRLHEAAYKADAQTGPGVPGAQDPLSNENPFLEEKLTEASAATKRDEPVVSQLASVSPDQKFDYPKIETRKNPYK